MQQLAIPGTDVPHPIKLVLNGCEYNICFDVDRKNHKKPAWYGLRIHDLAFTERYYSGPDGCFSAIYHERCSWRRN